MKRTNIFYLCLAGVFFLGIFYSCHKELAGQNMDDPTTPLDLETAKQYYASLKASQGDVVPSTGTTASASSISQ